MEVSRKNYSVMGPKVTSWQRGLFMVFIYLNNSKVIDTNHSSSNPLFVYQNK
jgi:hypothetical protein